MPQRRASRSDKTTTNDTTTSDTLRTEMAQDAAEIERAQRAAFEAEVAAQQREQQARDDAETQAARLEEMRARDAEQVLAEYAGQLDKLRAELAQRRAAFDQMEQEELARQDTPLSYDPMITSCNFAVVTYPAGESIPRFDFPTLKCIKGKSRPDQDCRTCVEVKLIPYGKDLPPHRRRYLRHGMVFPLRTNDEADSIINVLNALGIRPLRSIREELNAIENSIKVVEAKQEQARRDDLERRQGKRG